MSIISDSGSSLSSSNSDLKIVLIGKLEACEKLGKAIKAARTSDESSSLKIKMAWSTSLNEIDVDDLSPSQNKRTYILIVVQPNNDGQDCLEKVVKEINYLPHIFLETRIVDVVIWRSKNVSLCHPILDDTNSFTRTYKVLLHFIMADIADSVEMNALKLYNRMKVICLFPEINTSLL